MLTISQATALLQCHQDLCDWNDETQKLLVEFHTFALGGKAPVDPRRMIVRVIDVIRRHEMVLGFEDSTDLPEALTEVIFRLVHLSNAKRREAKRNRKSRSLTLAKEA